MDSNIDLKQRLQVGERIARSGGLLAKKHFLDRDSLLIEKKGAQDYVSTADREVEDLIKGELASHFPNDGFLGEETGSVGGEAVWVVDPIDGTSNFVRGIPTFGVSIAYVVNNRVEVGIVYDPIADEMYSAVRGAPSTRNGKPITTRREPKLSEAVVCIGFSTNVDHARSIAAIKDLLEVGCEFRRTGCAALGLTHVADGRFDAFWQGELSSWDVLGGLLVVQQAGGVTNDFLETGDLKAANVMFASGKEIAPPVAEILGVKM